MKFLISVVLFAVSSGAEVSAQMQVREPGTYTQTLRVGSQTVSYTISVPAKYPANAPVPLVLALHFGGSPNLAGQRLFAGLVGPGLDQLGAIIVAPDSLGGGWDSLANEQAVNALMDAVQASYRIDARRIAVTGFSMGGAGTWYFAGKYPERFSAAIPISGMPSATVSSWKTPVFAIHSRDDEVVPIGPARTRLMELKKAGVRAEFVELSGISHGETYRFVDALRRAVPWLKETWK